MAVTYTSTGTISNLTRVELEQLRKADFFSNSKALTIGDSALLPEGVVGKGNVNAEPYFTGPNLKLDDVYSADLPQQPGPGLTTLSSVGGMISETVRWYGPSYIFDSPVGFASFSFQWQDNTPGLNYALFVQPGDLLLIKQPTTSNTTDSNRNTVATITAVFSANQLTLDSSSLVNPDLDITNLQFGGGTEYGYVIVRPKAVQLFAVPGSGPGGREQTFLAVIPTSSLHSNLAPTLDQINADRITNLIPPSYAANTSIDRADSVFASPAPRTGLDLLGYRVILYRDNGTGIGPNLNAPLAALNPVIDSTIAASDQRMTFDFKAGIVRFSCAPRLGDDIKVTGGVNPTSGRLSLYAVFWAVDTSLSAGSSRSVRFVRSTSTRSMVPATIEYSGDDFWTIGATSDGNDFIVDAKSAAEVPGTVTSFGVYDTVNNTEDPRRFFVYRRTINPGDPQIGFGWRSKEFSRQSGIAADADINLETRISDKQSWSLGNTSGPAQALGADFNPEPYVFGVYGDRWVLAASALNNAALAAAQSGYGVVHLRRGTYNLAAPVPIPPGVEIRGEGSATIVKASSHITDPNLFYFGANTQYGTYDFSVAGGASGFAPLTFSWAGSIEGYDIVWNSARRVWGIVQADLLTNEIWFNEVNPLGQALYPGVGIPIKQNANVLYSNNSPNSQHHAGSHYPRIAHQYTCDEYSFVWVEEVTTGLNTGPTVLYQSIQHDPVSGAYIRKITPNAIQVGGGNWSDHPSIAVDNHQYIPTLYGVAVCCWNYDDPVTLATPQFGAYILDNTNGSVTTDGTAGLDPKQVISSTDVAADDGGNFLFAFSLRAHPIYYQTTGTSTALNPFLSDASPPAGDFNVAGVLGGGGTRYVQLWQAGNTDAGRSGLLGLVGSGAFSVHFDDFHNNQFRTSSVASVHYALVPASAIRTLAYTALGGFTFVNQVAGGLGLDLTKYQMTEREPDFVRVQAGNGNYIVVYQNFDTNGYLSQDSLLKFYAGGSLNARSLVAQRQHISTAYVIVSHDGLLVGPSEAPPEFNPGNDFVYASNAYQITMRSMGGRTLNVPNANFMGGWSAPGFINETRVEMEVSARNYCLPWTATLSPSFIPDVTWSGMDWVIVSPTVAKIASDTGTYRFDGVNNIFEDPSYFFFQNGTSYTVNPGTDQIYFPATGETILVSSVIGEHGVILASAPSFANPTHQVSWILRRNADFNGPYGTRNGSKNSGYRVSSTGEVIIGSEFFTYADDPQDSDLSTARVQELLDRKLWGDATFTGDVGSGQFSSPLPRFGAAFINWNDACPTSAIAGNPFFRGITVGAPKAQTEEFPNEQPMVAIAWGENYYGYLDRLVATGSLSTGFFRQSFGPWNSGLKDMAIQAGSVASNPSTRGLQVLTKEHAFTRHGYVTSGQPNFATDGFRNVFSFVGMQYLQASYPYLNQAPLGDLREEEAYYKNLNTIHTDATGRDPIFHRGPPMLFGDSPREFVDNLGTTGSIPIAGSGIERMGVAAPKVIWNGKGFVAFYPVMVPTPIPPGLPQPSNPGTSAGGTEAGPQGFFWPKYRGVINMVNLHGDESLNNINDALVANVQQQDGNFFESASANSPKIVANAVISCGAFGDWELREAAILDVAYSGKVYCVVWAMGFNTSSVFFSLRNTGGSVIGYSLFPDLEGANDILYSQGPTGVPSYTIETSDFYSPGSRVMEKGRFLNPKILWNGKKFVISFQYLDDSLGTTDNGKSIRSVFVSEDGPGAKTMIKALSANTRQSNSATVQGVRRNGGAGFIGTLQGFGLFQNIGLVIRSAAFDTPYSNFVVMPGDIVEITGITPGAEGAVADTSYNGFYPVQDWAMLDTNTMVVDLGNTFGRLGPIIGAAFVHGAIYTGGIATNALEVPDGSALGGVNTKSYFLVQNATTNTDLTMAAYVTRYHGMAYNPVKDEYVILAEVQLTDSTDRRLRLLMVKGSTMTVIKEKDLTPLGEDIIPAAIAWNGSQYLVVYGLDPLTATFGINYIVVSSSLTIEQQGELASVGDVVWDGSNNRAMPGPAYATLDLTLDLRPVLDSFHIEWNDRLSRWAVSASIITGGQDTTPYSAHFNEKQLIFRESNNISSWVSQTINLTGSSTLTQPGQRVIISREEDGAPGTSPVSPQNYGLNASSGSTTLNGDIGGNFITDTTIVVSSGTGFPTFASATFPFYITILSPVEVCLVTNVVGTTWTVVRGLFGTACAPHASLSTVYTIADGVTVVDSSLLSTTIYTAGDQVQLTTSLEKPRRIVYQRPSALVTEGSLFSPSSSFGYPPTSNTYKVYRRGRGVVVQEGAGSDGTWTATSLTSTIPHDFIALGVKPGMELVVYDAGTVPSGTQRVEIISISGAGNKVITFSPALGTVPFATSPYWVRKQSNIFANITSRGSATQFDIDVNASDRLDPAFFHNAPTGTSNAVDKIYYMIREDVFVWTLGYTAPAVKVRDADSVYMENVDIGGYLDIEERYYHMARPLRRQGGPAFGYPAAGLTNSRGPTDYVFLSPANKVETLRLSNVRSRTHIRYGDTSRRIKVK